MLPVPVKAYRANCESFNFCKIEINAERLLICYKEVTNNIRELKGLGELPHSIFTDDIGPEAESGSLDIVQQMVANQVVWHKSCRTLVDNQKVQRDRKRHQESEAHSPGKKSAFEWWDLYTF